MQIPAILFAAIVTVAYGVTLNSIYRECLYMFNGDYNTFTDEDKSKLGVMVNLTKALSVLYGKQIGQEDDNE